MKNTRDIKLVIQPVMSVMVHEYVFEGPCRFGSGDQLTVDFDRMNGAEGYKIFKAILKDKFENCQEFEVLDPVECEINESFEISEQLMSDITVNDAIVDCYLFFSVQRTYPVMLQTAIQTGKLIALQPKCCGSTMVPAMINTRGYECISPLTWDEMVETLKVYRVKKVLKESKALLLTRAYTNAALVSAPDGFLNLDDATRIFGTKFTYLDVHEFLDQTEHKDPTMNHTKPGWNGLNLTDSDMAEIEEMANRYITNAVECTMSREDVIQSLRFYKTTEKMLDHYECNCFSAPCPEMCATRRLNANKFTPCMTHSILNGKGVCSACEYDVPGLLTQIILSSFAQAGCWMGNTTVVEFKEDGITPYLVANPTNDLGEKTAEMTKEERDHLVYTFHSSMNLKLTGYDKPEMEYSIHPYTGSRWGVTFRHDFAKEKGQPITVARISPNGKTLLVARGTIVASVGESLDGCTQGLAYTVKDKYDFYKKQQQVGNHCPLVFGDYYDQVVELGNLLGLEILEA